MKGKNTRYKSLQAIGSLLTLSMLALAVACSSSPTKTTTQPVSVGLSSFPTTLFVSDTQPITATVTNDSSNAGVSWSCAPSGSCGTFSATTSASGTPVTYTAPATVPSSTVVITATSVASSTATASTSPITINLTSGITVALSGEPSTLATGSTAMITATVTGDTANGGVSWSCAPAGSCGSFSPTTSASAAAVTYTAPSSAGKVTVAATSVTDNAQSATATITVTNSVITSLPAGNYVFSLAGTDNSTANGTSPYFYAGAFAVSNSGAITGGEQDFSDIADFVTQEQITGGSVVPTPNGNLIITLTFTDSYIANGAGTVMFDASPVSASKSLLSEYDSWATSSGELDLQSTTLATPTGSFAFATSGPDYFGCASSVGGVINVDSAGGISGSGSVLDINDACVTSARLPGTFFAQTLTTGTVTTPTPNPYGFVTFALNSTCDVNADPDLCITGAGINASILLNGYMVDANHIRLVENWNNDSFSGTTGGTALSQGSNTGTFTTASASGSSYVIGTGGYDPIGTLQVAGLLTFNSDGTSMAGNLSYNDIDFQNAQGGEAITAGNYIVDPAGTGRVTITGVSDTSDDFAYNFQAYLTGDGHALVISMDSTATNPDVLAGPGWQQTTSTLNAASFSGGYALGVAGELQNGVGAFNADGVGALSGFVDLNEELLVSPGVLGTDTPFSGTFTAGSNGIFSITGPSSSGTEFTSYMIDTTKGVVIENDSSALMLGYFETQQ